MSELGKGADLTRSPVIGGADAGACIYCGEDATTAKREAHAYPVALFNNAMILPPGVECDECNEFAESLERALLGHNRIGVSIIWEGVPGRRGKLRKRIGAFSRDPSGNMQVHAVAKVAQSSADVLSLVYPDNVPLDDGRFRRALHHIGLNHLALVAGASVARETRFDAVRGYVRYGTPNKPWPYAQFMYRDNEKRKELGCSHLRREVGAKVRIRTFHDDFYVDLEPGQDLHSWARQVLPSTTGIL